MARIAFRELSKRFGSVEAVRSLSLDIEDGEFVVLVGPSGCGKTTTLRMLAGLEAPSSGSIRLGERDITEVEAKDRNIAMVFQTYALYPHMTVFENMSFALRLQRKGRAEIEAAVRRAAGLMGIEHLLARRPRELSGGQRQRVAVCRAIVRDPDAFLFDEPLSNLDAKLRASARAEIRRLQRTLAVTTVYVTHDQVEAMTMADRIVVMDEGRVQQVGAPMEIYARPANVFVAAFIGSPPMNLLPVSAVPLDLRGAAAAGAATLGFRPEDVHLVASDCRQPSGFRVRVDDLEALGAETLLQLSGNAGAFQCRIPGRAGVAVGDVLDVFVDLAEAHFFDEAGARIDACKVSSLPKAVFQVGGLMT